MDKPSIILVEPEIPENTGFTARLAANYRYSLRIVDPEFNLKKARKTAKNSQEKLRNAKIFSNVKEAVEDLEYVAGTKPGRGQPLENFEPKQNTSLMIGRESSGLTNKELELCDTVLHLNVPGYSSLNQSHATAILLHSLSTADKKEGMEEKQKQKIQELAPKNIAEKLVDANPSKNQAGKIIEELIQRKE